MLPPLPAAGRRVGARLRCRRQAAAARLPGTGLRRRPGISSSRRWSSGGRRGVAHVGGGGGRQGRQGRRQGQRQHAQQRRQLAQMVPQPLCGGARRAGCGGREMQGGSAAHEPSAACRHAAACLHRANSLPAGRLTARLLTTAPSLFATRLNCTPLQLDGFGATPGSSSPSPSAVLRSMPLWLPQHHLLLDPSASSLPPMPSMRSSSGGGSGGGSGAATTPAGSPSRPASELAGGGLFAEHPCFSSKELAALALYDWQIRPEGACVRHVGSWGLGLAVPAAWGRRRLEAAGLWVQLSAACCTPRLCAAGFTPAQASVGSAGASGWSIDRRPPSTALPPTAPQKSPSSSAPTAPTGSWAAAALARCTRRCATACSRWRSRRWGRCTASRPSR